jgi:hypothetical protein
MERRKEDATSKATLEDLDENEAPGNDDSDEDDLPSPDGAYDDSDELKDADPV